MDVFQAEEDGCRAYAQQQTAAGATPRQSRYDIAYIQCMYSKGNVIPGGVAPAPHLRQDKLGFLLITQRYAAIGSPPC
jgi:hypothetical protein